MSLYGGEAELSLFRWGAVGIAGVAGLVLGAGMLAIAIGLFRFYAACCGFRRVHWIGNPMQHHHECALRRFSEVSHFPICRLSNT